MFGIGKRFEVFTLAFLIFLLAISFGQKPVISVYVQVEDQSFDQAFKKLAESTVFDEVYECRKFEVLLQNALSQLSSELVLQDLFSNQNVVLSKEKNSEVELRVVVTNLDVYTTESYVEYVENSISGDYINVGGEYVRIYTGVKYKYDLSTSSYIQDPDGWYVRGYNGKYYVWSTFYSFAPHTEVYYVLKAHVKYSLITKVEHRYADLGIEEADLDYLLTTNDPYKLDFFDLNFFDISARVVAKGYAYDPYNNRLITVLQGSTNDIFNRFASALSNKLRDQLTNAYKITGNVESIKFPRTIVNVGDKDGVKVDSTFKIFSPDQETELSELRVIRTGGDYSECEVVYLKKGYTLKPNDIVVESNPTFLIPISFGLTYRMDDTLDLATSTVSLNMGMKQYDIHRDVSAYLNFGANVTVQNLTEYLSYVMSYMSGSQSSTQVVELRPTFEMWGGYRLFGNGVSLYALGMIRFQDTGYLGLGLKAGILEIEAYSNLSFDRFLFGGGLLW